jgi:hypothetical protein
LKNRGVPIAVKFKNRKHHRVEEPGSQFLCPELQTYALETRLIVVNLQFLQQAAKRVACVRPIKTKAPTEAGTK